MRVFITGDGAGTFYRDWFWRAKRVLAWPATLVGCLGQLEPTKFNNDVLLFIRE